MKILIVDDCRTTRKLLGHYLKTRGYSVSYAENGLDALEKIGPEGVHLVMTDLNMPYMDGMELIKTLQADPDLSEIPILMITTENDDNERDRALSYGASGYVVKPIMGDELADKIKSILQNTSTEGGVTNV